MVACVHRSLALVVIALISANIDALTVPPPVSTEQQVTSTNPPVLTEGPLSTQHISDKNTNLGITKGYMSTEHTTLQQIVTEGPMSTEHTTLQQVVTEGPMSTEDTTPQQVITEGPMSTEHTTPQQVITQETTISQPVITEEPTEATTTMPTTTMPATTATTSTPSTTVSTSTEPPTTTVMQTTLTPCERRMVDIGFLLDSSGSEGRTNFNTQVTFVKNFVSQLDIGPSAVQVGLVTFDTNVHRQFFLNQYDDRTSVLSALAHVPYNSGATYTERALAYMHDTFFKPAAGARAGVPRVVVLLTDGKSVSPSSTEREAARLKQSGVKVIAVGIGSSLGLSELRAIASDPTSVITVASFNSLLTHIQSVKDSMCRHIGAQQLSPGATASTQQGGYCGTKPADIIFVLDASYSEGEKNFHKQVEFVANVTAQLDISPTEAQVGLLTFATDVHNQFYLNQHTTKYSVQHALTRIPFQTGATFTGKALRFVRTNSLSTIHGRRPNSQPIVIVLTDGQSSDKPDTVHEASLLKDTGALVIAIGIGTSADSYELRQIATDTAHVFTVLNFDFLSAIQQQILTEACANLGPTPTVSAECGSRPSDIVFLLDSSSSEAMADFSRMKEFVSNFAKHFQIGPQNVQISVISFSTTAHVAFYLNAYQSQTSLQSGIARIPYYGGSTHTDLALSTARNAVLSASHGARSGASKTVILLTDGMSTDTQATTRQAALLKQGGANVITIGVGSSVNHDEMEAVATDIQHSFAVASFSALHSIQQELVNAACHACSGSEAADILLLLDASTEGGHNNFVREVTFATKLINDFTVSADRMQFSVLTYASLPNSEFWFNSYSATREMIFALQTLQPTSGSSNLGGALRFAREYAYAPFHGARDDKSHYAIVLIDSRSDNVNETIDQAAQLSQEGVTVLVVGIGDQVDKNELSSIASEPSNVFLVPDYTSLSSLHKDIQQKICSSLYSASNTTVATTGSSNQLIG